MSTQLKTEKIESHDVTFYVTDEGAFWAKSAVLEDAVHGSTLLEVKTKIRAKLRRATAKLAIKVHLVNTYDDSYLAAQWYKRKEVPANLCRPVTLTGISARSSGDVMFTFEDSNAKTKRRGHQQHTEGEAEGIFVRRLTAEGVKEYERIRKAHDDAKAALAKWIAENKIEDVAAFVETKIQEAVDSTSDEEEPDTEDPRVMPDAPLRDTRFDGAKKKGERKRG